MLKDIDYAAIAVKKAIVEKFGQEGNLEALEVNAGECTIVVRDGMNVAESTRDQLLAGVRAAHSYQQLWKVWQHP